MSKNTLRSIVMSMLLVNCNLHIHINFNKAALNFSEDHAEVIEIHD